MIEEVVMRRAEGFLNRIKGSEAVPMSPLEAERIAEAKLALDHLDFPSAREEYWKYTRTGKIANAEYSFPKEDEDSAEIDEIPGMDAYKFVFSNNRLIWAAENLPGGIHVLPISEALSLYPEKLESVFARFVDHENHIFSALNLAFEHFGLAVIADKNAVLDKPIHIIQVLKGNGLIIQPRHIVVAGALSQIQVMFSYHAEEASGCFINGVSETHIGEGASVRMHKLEKVKGNNHLVFTDEVRQERDSRFKINTINLKGNWVRNNFNLTFNGENAEGTLNGLYLLKDNQHVDNHTIVDHRVPHCLSNELYKGILDDTSTGVFNGKVFVRQDAQKTNAFQSNANILISDTATMNSKPELEIYADDVKCSHGSTTGQLNDEALFYLQARGIGKERARLLLVEAFARDVIDQIVNENLRSYVNDLAGTHFSEKL